MQLLKIRVDTFLRFKRSIPPKGAQLWLFKPIRVSKADVIRMGAGEGKETTEKGKLET